MAIIQRSTVWQHGWAECFSKESRYEQGAPRARKASGPRPRPRPQPRPNERFRDRLTEGLENIVVASRWRASRTNRCVNVSREEGLDITRTRSPQEASETNPSETFLRKSWKILWPRALGKPQQESVPSLSCIRSGSSADFRNETSRHASKTNPIRNFLTEGLGNLLTRSPSQRTPQPRRQARLHPHATSRHRPGDQTWAIVAMQCFLCEGHLRNPAFCNEHVGTNLVFVLGALFEMWCFVELCETRSARQPRAAKSD